MVTGIDLVQTQLRVAAGEPLAFAQRDVVTRGHAIECRIYAEDPSHGMLPQSGRLLLYREPEGEGVRVDSGVREDQTVTVHYDPMLAKLIVWAKTREAALVRMADALGRFHILGLRHNIPFLRALVQRREVAAPQVDTSFIEAHLAELTAAPEARVVRAAVAIAAFVATRKAAMSADNLRKRVRPDPWRTLGRITW
jgi:acetyl/propionyl-CoA carboxylase alpha subunit